MTPASAHNFKLDVERQLLFSASSLTRVQVINLTKKTLCQGLKHRFKESNCPHIERIHSFVSFSSHFQSRSPRSESFTDERRAPTRAKGMRYYSKFEVKIAEQSILAPPVHSCQRSLGKHQPRAVSKPAWVADNS